MDLGEMKDWVVRTTKRPEKRDEQIQDAINAAIEYATTQGDFVADLVEGSTALSSSVYAQSISITTVMPRFRKVKYLRPINYRRYLTHRDPTKVFEEKRNAAGFSRSGYQAIDVWYRAGDNIVMSLSTLQTSLLFGYFTYPVFLTDDAETHWMLDQMRTCIHDLSCWRTYEQIGDKEEATRFYGMGQKLLVAHKSDLTDGVSYS